MKRSILPRSAAKRVHLLAFAIPLLLFFLIMILRRVYPFGDRTLLISDMNNQYISYFAYYKSIFSSRNDMIYSFAKTLGGDIVGLEAYYLLSPLNIIFLFIPLRLLPLGVTLLIGLKLALAGFTFSFFLRSRQTLTMTSLIFTTAYSLMAYNSSYLFNVMWLDAVILLPLIALGIRSIVERGSGRLYLITLSLAVITNYYMGFMLCIFSALYFIYTLLCQAGRSKYQGREIRRIIFGWLIHSLWAVALAAFILVPTIFSLQGGKASFTFSEFDLSRNFAPGDLLSKLYPNSVNWNEINSGLPLIYVGILPLVLLPLYFLNKQISLREKILSLLFLFVLVSSFVVNAFNLIWHGFNSPYGFPYRYAFLFSFLLIDLSHEAFRKMEGGLRKRHLLPAGALFMLMSVYVYQKDQAHLNTRNILLSSVLAVAALLILAAIMNRKKTSKRSTVLLLCLISLHMADMFLNSYASVRMLQASSSADMSAYVNYIDKGKQSIGRIQARDDSFYRLEKTFYRSLNDPLLLNYRGLSHYSSSEQDRPKEFMGKIGFRHHEYWSFYNRGGTEAADNFLGIKYLLSDLERPMQPNFEKLFTEGSIEAYQNTNVLPMGFAVREEALSATLRDKAPLANLNTLYSAGFGGDEEVFSDLSIEETSTVNLTASDESDYIRYDKISADAPAYMEFLLRAESRNQLYAWFDAPRFQDTEILVNGESLGSYFDIMQWDIVRLGSFEPGTEVRVRIVLNGEFLDLGEAVFAEEDHELLSDYTAQVRQHPFSITEHSSSHLSAEVYSPEGLSHILFTIPWEENWQLTLDGEAVSSEIFYDTFLGVEVSPGHHQLDLRYRPRGGRFGLLISVSALLLYAAWALIAARRSRVKSL